MVDDARVDLLDVVRECHRFVDDELLKLERSRLASKVTEVPVDCSAPDSD